MNNDDLTSSNPPKPTWQTEKQGVSKHTGFPNPAIDASLQNLDLNALLIRHGPSTYFMRIDSNLWAEQGIFAGDIVLIDRTLKPRLSDLVAWWDGDQFAMSVQSRMPKDTVTWGVVSAAIHRFRGYYR